LAIDLAFGNDLGRYQVSGDRTGDTKSTRAGNVRVRFEYLLDLFRIDLRPTDVDHAVRASEKEHPVAAELDLVAGMQPAVICERGGLCTKSISSHGPWAAHFKYAVADAQRDIVSAMI
jgi:hypothetical protein